MALHPDFPRSPYAPLVPSQRWFPADETLRSTAYEKLLPPLVAKIREEVYAWRQNGYAGASTTSVSLLHSWFETEHLIENADGSLSPFRYYFAQREAVETLIWLYDVRRARDKFDLLRFDASGAVSSGMFDEDWPRYVLVTPRFDKKNPLGVSAELTDFSVYYSQGVADAIAAELKDGKSEVVCDTGALIKISKDKQGVITREVLTKHWTDWVDYWAVDFNFESRKEMIKVPKGTGVNTVQGHLPGQEPAQRDLALPVTEFEERWTGAYIFENEWQSFRTRQSRELEMTTAPHTYEKPGRYTIAVKVIDIFGNDTMTLVPITVG